MRNIFFYQRELNVLTWAPVVLTPLRRNTVDQLVKIVRVLGSRPIYTELVDRHHILLDPLLHDAIGKRVTILSCKDPLFTVTNKTGF